MFPCIEWVLWESDPWSLTGILYNGKKKDVFLRHNSSFSHHQHCLWHKEIPAKIVCYPDKSSLKQLWTWCFSNICDFCLVAHQLARCASLPPFWVSGTWGNGEGRKCNYSHLSAFSALRPLLGRMSIQIKFSKVGGDFFSCVCNLNLITKQLTCMLPLVHSWLYTSM